MSYLCFCKVAATPYLIVADTNGNSSNLYEINPTTGRTQPLLSPGVASNPVAVAVDQTRGYCYWTDVSLQNIYRYDFNTGSNILIKYVAGCKWRLFQVAISDAKLKVGLTVNADSYICHLSVKR